MADWQKQRRMWKARGLNVGGQPSLPTERLRRPAARQSAFFALPTFLAAANMASACSSDKRPAFTSSKSLFAIASWSVCFLPLGPESVCSFAVAAFLSAASLAAASSFVSLPAFTAALT